MKGCNNCNHAVWIHARNPIPEICLECRYVSVNGEKEPSNWEPTSHTNADRIRAMTDTELAKACCEYIDCMACPCGVDCIQVGKSCEKRMLEWLQQPAQEE